MLPTLAKGQYPSHDELIKVINDWVSSSEEEYDSDKNGEYQPSETDSAGMWNKYNTINYIFNTGCL